MDRQSQEKDDRFFCAAIFYRNTGSCSCSRRQSVKAVPPITDTISSRYGQWMNKCFLASLGHDTNEINFAVINLFDGIEIKLDIKEHEERVTGYTLQICIPQVIIIQKHSGMSFVRRIVFYRPKFYCPLPLKIFPQDAMLKKKKIIIISGPHRVLVTSLEDNPPLMQRRRGIYI